MMEPMVGTDGGTSIHQKTTKLLTFELILTAHFELILTAHFEVDGFRNFKILFLSAYRLITFLTLGANVIVFHAVCSVSFLKYHVFSSSHILQ